MELKNSTNNISTPNLSLPKGGGAIQGIGETFAANAFAGTGTLSIPISTSPARGLEPQLSLDYNSGSGNGIFGIGFGLSLPNISRKTDKGIPKYDDTDIFILSNAEELVPIKAKDNINWNVITYQPRTEGLFAQIEQWLNPNTNESYWQVITKENVTHIYGKTASARIAAPNDNARIFSWLIEETIDSKGNKVLYHYKPGDNVNEPAAVYNVNHDYTSNQYIQKIQYGNYSYDNNGTPTEQYAFEIIFDYGEYDINAPDNAPGTWASRQDPFSSYRAGFEIRTNRLCHNILMFHHFSEEFNNQRFLVRATHFEYDDNPIVSTLTSIQEIGYRKADDGSGYETRAMPPLQFNYSPFNPTEQSFKQLSIANNGTVPGSLSSQFMLVDIYGGGIPGILQSNDTTTLYWKPQGNGTFGGAQAPLQFPIHRNLQAANQTLTDLDGDGQLELVVREATYGGYYQVQADQSWTPYQSFRSYPPEINTPSAELVNLDGNGRADLLVFDEQALRIYPSQGVKGYAPPRKINQEQGFPLTPNEYAKEVLSFADIFGDGLSHRVRIRSGNVECWPDLGYGQFGSKIILGTAPQFGEFFNAARLFLADIDGTGTIDLVYVHPDRVEIFFNQSGNSFSQPISIPLPEAYSDLDQITFGDVLGNGTSCLIFTKMAPTVRHYYYEFVSPTDCTVPHFTAGVKPYLLTEIDNNLGATTRIQYCSSTQFYLEDEQQGKPWATKLPFPVQVVAKVETIDNISKSKFVTRYKYHNGYYDQVEREFRGFAFVEQWDTEDFNAFSQPGLHDEYQGENLNPALHVPPVHTKRWYCSGAYTEADALAQQFAEQRYQGDSQALPVPDCQFASPILSSDAETIRQAHRALRGQLIQEEIYGLDKQPDLSENPYQITASNYQVNLLQPRGDQKYAVFLVQGLENLQYDYERNPTDPRISHNFTLDVDDYGNVLKSCAVSYPRRLPLSTGAENPADDVYPQQKQLQAVANTGSFINDTADFRRIGIQSQSQVFEIGGLDLNGQDYFSFDEIQTQIDDALNNQIPFDQTVSNQTLQARLLDWQRYYYWNETQDAALALGQISARALLHHSETAVFTPKLITNAFDSKVTDDMLSQDGEYYLNDNDGYWWNQGLIYSYYSAENQFYRLNQTQNYAATNADFSSKTEWEYDAYYLTVLRQTDFLSDTETNISSVEVDYHTLQPWQITDINNNISQALFDPLGYVIVTTIYGTVDSNQQGDSDISTYVEQEGATFDDVVNNPSNYLQQATTYFYYDLFAWQSDQQPPCAINLIRETHVSDLPAGEESRIQIHITYSDGFGREVESKIKAEPGQAFITQGPNKGQLAEVTERWLVSGRTVYNNKAKPVEQYLPYYTDTPHYEDQTTITTSGQLPPPTVTHYDPLVRPIRVDTPKGFFSKTTFTPWQQKVYDEDDTVKDSPYYQAVEAGEITISADEQADEQDALDKAAKFYDTPAEKVLDNLGRSFLDIQINVNEAEEFVYLKTQSTLDIEGNVLTMTDPRLATPNFTYLYDMQGNALKTDSVDAGVRQGLQDIYGNPIHSWDERGFHQSLTYDTFQRPTIVHVEGSDAQGLTLNQIVEQKVYGETQADSQNNNLRGQLASNYDQAGIEYFYLYNIQGQILTAQRKLRQDYKTEVNWDNPNTVLLESEVNWDNPNTVLLESEVFEMVNTYDALNRITTQTTPDESVSAPQYDQAGLLKSTEVTFAGESQSQPFITNIEYNANGQREVINYGNGVVTQYTYEDTTNRLVAIISTQLDGTKLQNLNYTYDPVGNITRLRDYTPQTIFCNQQQVEPVSNYTYDALYQLTKATGRQHPGLQQNTYRNSFEPIMSFCPPSTQDGQKLENYTQTYQYDVGNNLIEINHQATSSPWRQEMPVATNSNRLQDKPYDANGNLLELDNLQSIQWDYRNNLSQADVILRTESDSDSEYYVYDSHGNRIRKISECQKSGGSLTEIEEKIYLGNYEVKRIKQVTTSGTTTILDRQSLRVMDDSTNIAIVHHWLKDDNGRETDDVGERQFRYQLGNLLGSVAVEVDKNANLISYEEYFPYGSTSLIAGDNQKEVKLKEYRYSGKEKDNVTGLYYYGARYYAPWMGRWMNSDPAGTVDGLNLFRMVKNNPVIWTDSDGRMPVNSTTPLPGAVPPPPPPPLPGTVPPPPPVPPRISMVQAELQARRKQSLVSLGSFHPTIRVQPHEDIKTKTEYTEDQKKEALKAGAEQTHAKAIDSIGVITGSNFTNVLFTSGVRNCITYCTFTGPNAMDPLIMTHNPHPKTGLEHHLKAYRASNTTRQDDYPRSLAIGTNKETYQRGDVFLPAELRNQAETELNLDPFPIAPFIDTESNEREELLVKMTRQINLRIGSEFPVTVVPNTDTIEYVRYYDIREKLPEAQNVVASRYF